MFHRDRFPIITDKHYKRVAELELDNYTLRKELAEVKAERDEIITVAHNRGIKDELEIDDLKAERDRLRAALEEIEKCILKGYSGTSRVIIHIARTALKEASE